MRPPIPSLLFAVLAARAAWSATDSIPPFFVENAGQVAQPVRFVAQASGGSAWFSPGEVAFTAGGSLVRILAVGANPSASIEGGERLAGVANFLLGPQDRWRVGVPLYRSITYRDLYPGIDMTYGSDGRNLKSQYVVRPGSDPARIRIAYLGASTPAVDESGVLIVSVGGNPLREQPPVIYQMRGTERQPVDGRFAVAADGTVRFIVGRYDASLPLVIDPTMVYSTLLGGSSSDAATAVAVDSSGDAYIAGFTASQNLPTASPDQNYNAGSNDAFIAKLNAGGNGLVYCTYLGGSGDDRAYALAVDSSGEAYVAGYTNSYNFPVHNPIQSSLGGARNAFVAKLGPAGNTLIFSTYLGGRGSDTAYALALDSSANAYVAGDTTSTNFPASNYQKTNRGSQNAFVVKIASTGSSLAYSTYLGGNSIDHGAAIAVDSTGAAYITGSTFSSNFPVSAGASQATLKGGQDAFVAKLSADGNSLVYGTYLGGSAGSAGYPESGQGIAVDSNGDAYVAGSTASSDFPILGGVQTSLDGWLDAFAAKFGPTGSLIYSTYLGGSGMDAANAIAIDSTGGAYLAGYTISTDLPVSGNALQATSGGDYDAFIARLNPAGNSLLYLSYLGGSASDTATGITLDSAGNAYVAGWTLSPNFPLANAYQSVNGGNYGAFLAKFSFATPPVNLGVTPASGSGLTQSFTFQFSDSYGAADLSTVSVLFNSSVALASACSVTYNQAANALSLLTDSGAAPSGTIAPGSGSQQNSQCTLSGTGSSVSLAGNTLTLTLSIAFQTAFTGSKNIYLQAANPLAANSWQQMGSWTVPAAMIQEVGVAPSSGSGTSQTFTFTFADTKGYTAIASAQFIVNNPLSVSNGCYVYLNRAAGLLYLMNNAATSWQGPITIGTSSTLQNSQCTLNASGSSQSGSGNNLTVNLSITFQSAFTGNKQVWAEVYDGALDSGWNQLGTFTVTSAPIAAVSVTPASGTGMSQTFSFLLYDSKGYTALASSQIIVNNPLGVANACYIYYARASNYLYLNNNAATSWLGPITMGTSATLQNSQCTVNAAGSSASGSGNNLTLNVSLTFQSSFTGAKQVWIEVYDGTLDTGWGQIGVWTP